MEERRRRKGSEVLAEVLLDAALVEFAAHGFDGAATRAIAERAGCHQPQINYHFSSKLDLWKAAVDRLYGLLADELAPVAAVADPVERFADGVRRFVRFAAERPELHRIMTVESTAPSERLEWIVERHLADRIAVTAAAWDEVRSAGYGVDLDGVDVYQLIIGMGALPFTNAPAIARFSGLDPADPASVEAVADRLLRLLGLLPARRRKHR